MIEDVIQDGIEGALLLGIGENDYAEIFFGNEHDARNETGDATGVADEFASVVIAQSPT